jgi:hypothetical protein
VTQPSAFDIEADDEGTPLPAPPLESDEFDEPESTPEPPVPVQATIPVQPPRPRGRPRKKPPEPAPADRPLGAAPPVPEKVVLQGAPDEESDDPRQWPSEALQVWPILLRWLGKRGLGPEAVGCTVSRKLVGPMVSDETKFQPLKGTSVRPYGSYSASEVLQRRLIDVYHAVGPEGGSQGCGPANYTLAWYWLGQGGTIKTSHTQLDSYQVLIEQRHRGEEADRASGLGQQSNFSPPPPFTSSPEQRYAEPQRQAAQTATATAPTDFAVAAEIGYLRRIKEESDRAAAEGRAPRPIEPTGAVAVSREDEDARIARAVTAALAAAGIKPKSDMDRMAELMQQNNDALMKNIIALYGDPASKVGAAGNPTPTQAADTVQDTVAGLKKLLQEFKTLREAEGIFKEALGADEDEPVTPTAITVEQKPKGAMEQVSAFFKGLPPGAIAQTMAVAGAFLEGSPVGEIVKKAAAAAQAAGAVSVAAEKARGPSWGPSNVG